MVEKYRQGELVTLTSEFPSIKGEVYCWHLIEDLLGNVENVTVVTQRANSSGIYLGVWDSPGSITWHLIFMDKKKILLCETSFKKFDYEE